MVTTAIDITQLLREFGGNPQQARGIAEFLGFDPVPSPEGQLAGPRTAGLKQFFQSRDDPFGVNDVNGGVIMYQAGSSTA